MYKKSLILILMMLLVLCGCSSNNNEMQSYNLNIKKIGAGEVVNSGSPTAEDRKVTLSAQPQEGEDDWIFDHWQGAVSSKENPLTIAAEENMQIVAVFKDIPNFTDTVENKKVFPGENIDFTISAKDSDSHQLDYSVVSADEKITGSFNHQTREFSHSGISTAGDYGITFKVSDGQLSTEKTIYIGVNGPPLIESIEQMKVIQREVPGKA